MGNEKSAMDNASVGPGEKGLVIADWALRISDWGGGSFGSTDSAIGHGE
jgi:hypothetical protein